MPSIPWGLRWAVLAAAIWVQAFSGTNLDFSAYSSDLKSVLGVSQVQLNYLAVASDLGKALGWSAGVALLYVPVWGVLVGASGMGLVGYLGQWLVVTGVVQLRYFEVFFLCLLSGCSICWFNTVCFVLCVRNFPSKIRSLALSLTVSFNGVSAVLFTLIANATTASSSDQPYLYLLINAIVPLLSSTFALFLILPHYKYNYNNFSKGEREGEGENFDNVFLVLYTIAFLTGVYLLFFNSVSSNHIVARALLTGALLLLILPLFIPSWMKSWSPSTMVTLQEPLIKTHEGLNLYHEKHQHLSLLLGMDKLVGLGEEHSPKRMVKRLDFWLYFVAYFFGATIGLVYSNNLGQISQSLGRSSETTMLVGVYSACSFFGRLLSAAPDFLRGTTVRLSYGRTTWLALGLVPTPISFFLLAATGHALLASTALLGLSSGFIFATAVSITSELFGPNNIGFNHNILITNIPIGSLLYGLLAAVVYDTNGRPGVVQVAAGNVCMGRECYGITFVAWGSISLVGLASSVLLMLRTRDLYAAFS